MTDTIDLEVLNEKIRRGWGDVRGDRIPQNWRQLLGPAITGAPVRYDHDGYAIWVDPIEAERVSLMPKIEGPLTLGEQVRENERERTYTRRRTWEQRVMERASTFSGRRRRRARKAA